MVVLDAVDVEAIDVIVLVALVLLEVDVSADVVDLPVVVVVELLDERSASNTCTAWSYPSRA